MSQSRPQIEFEPLFTPAEVARLFRVDPKTVARWAQAGRLPHIRTAGGHRRYRESDIRALLGGLPATAEVPEANVTRLRPALETGDDVTGLTCPGCRSTDVYFVRPLDGPADVGEFSCNTADCAVVTFHADMAKAVAR